MKILIRGGEGFVGHHFVEHFIKNTNADIVVLDKLSYSSEGFDRLRDINVFNDKRVLSLATDLTKSIPEGIEKEIGDVDYILHLGAESHVDNSITNPEPFVINNVVGTMNILNLARKLYERGKLKCFFYFGTDEVFGPAPIGVNYKEEDRHNPTNPYSASKSGGEMLVKAYRNTYRLPAIITRSTNIFGERQNVEKFIPMCIKNILADKEILIHANYDKTKSGSRFYIHARNVADGYLFLIEKIEGGNKFIVGQDYHITGDKEVYNLEMAQFIAKVLGKELKYRLIDFHSSRPGHDLRYSLDDSKIKELGWKSPKNFEESLKKTVEWTLENKRWLV
jgi:dTDP-glucose 4,6-dehydratase